MTLNLSKVKDVYFEVMFQSQTDSTNSSTDTFSNNKSPKVLLLDNITTSFISLCYTQSQLLSNDIILVELIESQQNLTTMKHLDCIVYINPNLESIKLLLSELRSPHYKKYYVYFNNVIGKNHIESIAEADEFEVIEKIIELFEDYYILNNELYLLKKPTINLPNPVVAEAEGLTSLLLALKKTPIIKYDSNSIELKRLSSEILYIINSNSNNNLFDDLNRRSDVPPVLLLLDRKNDIITPLMTPWTYQSMIHEFLTIDKNVVALPDNQIVLGDDDPFFNQSLFLNYGDLNDNYQKYFEKYKLETKQSSINNDQLLNISELKKTLTKFPEFQKFSTNIGTHVNLISKIDEELKKQHLWEIGELQQTIICGLESQSNIKTTLLEVLQNKNISTVNKIKLILLYTYKFHESSNDLNLFISKLNEPSFTQEPPAPEQIHLIKNFNVLFDMEDSKRNQQHQQSSQDQPFNNNITKNINQQGLANLFSNNKVNFKKFFNKNETPENDNVYLQYTPKLKTTIQNLLNPDSNARPNSFFQTLIPEKVKQQYGNNSSNNSIQDLIIYIKGGVTYEEYRIINELSKLNPKLNIIIGGDEILNSEKWLNKLYELNQSKQINSNSTNVSNSEFLSDGIDRRTALRDIL
ncbi:VPS45 [Candida pseudojiufengensis]|uniref:VPS45 n=1 Tax=Candida pseudojiufengensis TaxID=497109 RepID=UPI002223FD58|nr:VPS45 [Candida pseudojiufengensis]KAI5963202.1 VPS45 [Candida pseudojiufengensis]